MVIALGSSDQCLGLLNGAGVGVACNACTPPHACMLHALVLQFCMTDTEPSQSTTHNVARLRQPPMGEVGKGTQQFSACALHALHLSSMQQACGACGGFSAGTCMWWIPAVTCTLHAYAHATRCRHVGCEAAAL
eukprot:363496-Chlamydomonas_euryale.AAC.2